MEIDDYHLFTEQREQALERLEMYIDSTRPQKREADVLIINEEDQFQVLVKNKIMTPKGLENILKELLGNASDHHTRTVERFKSKYPLKPIEVTISGSTITVKNYGAPIPIEKKDDLYVPFIIFGKMNSSSNYFGKRSGLIGMNGLGSKIGNIVSTQFTCTVLNGDSRKQYYQKWYNNMSRFDPAEITDNKTKESSVSISATIDMKLFGYPEEADFDELTVALFFKTCLDFSYATKYKISVNEIMLDTCDIKKYLRYYYSGSNFVTHSQTIDDQSIEVTYFDSPQQIMISFLNGVITREHGNHVQACLKAIKGFNNILNAKFKKEKIKLNAKNLKDNISLIVNFRTDKPEASGQSKNIFEGDVYPFEVPETKIKKMIKWDIAQDFMNIMNAKVTKVVTKTDGKSSSKVICKKLDDATLAGQKRRDKSLKRLLFGVEGDSASGYPTYFRKHTANGAQCIGILSFRGKLINPCDKSAVKLSENEDINNLKIALGIKEELDYTDDKNFAKLRYDGFIILTDQDVDGSHITGLILNLFLRKFPTLLVRDDFIVRMITPLVRASFQKQVQNFYSVGDFDIWKQSIPRLDRWTINYNKGLASSTPGDIKQDTKDPYFIKLGFDEEAVVKLDLAFDKKLADARKEWLQEHNITFGTFTTKITEQKISTFIDNELREYSIDTLSRAIPKLIDGMKKSHVEILWAAMNNWSRKDILIEEPKEAQKKTEKVSQFSGYISKFVNYHHGEDSLNKTIVRMTQSFLGSNNLSYFYQHGIFGTRKKGGDDAGQPRYVKVKPLWWIHYVYRVEDMEILVFEEDEGKKSEPKFMLPIIPMLLVNGMKGIATGFSTNIPSINIFSLIEALINKLTGSNEVVSLDPYFRGFKGTVELEENKYYTVGNYELDEEGRLIITEIPVTKSMNDFKADLDKMLQTKQIDDYADYSDDQNAYFVVVGNKFTDHEDIIKCYGLRDSGSLKNLITLTNESIPAKHESVEQILDKYYELRLPFFELRKQNMISNLDKQIKLVNDRVKFIRLVLDEKINWKNIPKQQISIQLAEHELDISIAETSKFMTFSKEKVDKLLQKAGELQMTLDTLKATSIQQLWLNDLNEFIDNYSEEKFELLCGGELRDEE